MRWLLRAGLLLDAVALCWLVWTPADAHRCGATTLWIGQVFCLSPWLIWVGKAKVTFTFAESGRKASVRTQVFTIVK